MLLVDFVLGLLFELTGQPVGFLPKFHLLQLNEIITLHLKVRAMVKEAWILCSVYLENFQGGDLSLRGGDKGGT